MRWPAPVLRAWRMPASPNIAAIDAGDLICEMARRRALALWCCRLGQTEIRRLALAMASLPL